MYASTGLTCLLCAYAGYSITGLEVQAANAKDNAQTMHRRFNDITTYPAGPSTLRDPILNPLHLRSSDVNLVALVILEYHNIARDRLARVHVCQDGLVVRVDPGSSVRTSIAS